MKPKKLILIDFNNVCYQVVFSKYLVDKYKGHTSEELNGENFDALVRDSIKMTFQKVFNILEWNQDSETDMLFAKDGYKLWRKKIFQEYKQHRKADRDSSDVDFGLVFKVFDKIWEELRSVLPYRFINIDTVETDDIINEVVRTEMDKYDKFQIYSTDGDFKQLLRYEKVELYNPLMRKFIEVIDPEYELFEKIIRGDKSDGIPNIFTDTITRKQTPIFTTKIKLWFEDSNEFEKFLQEPNHSDIKYRYERNKRLIDMREIPESISRAVQVELSKDHPKFNLQEYLRMSKKYGITIMEEKGDLITQ
jgi:hypothetical protein